MENSLRLGYLSRLRKLRFVEDMIHENEAGRKARAYTRALRTLDNIYSSVVNGDNEPIIAQFNDDELEKAISEYEKHCRQTLHKALHILKDDDQAILKEYAEFPSHA